MNWATASAVVVAVVALGGVAVSVIRAAWRVAQSMRDNTRATRLLTTEFREWRAGFESLPGRVDRIESYLFARRGG